MNLSSLQHSLLPAAILSGIVVSAIAAPLASWQSQSIAIQFEQESIFANRFNPLTPLQAGLLGATSLGAGAASIALLRWTHSRQKSVQVEEEIAVVKQYLHIPNP